MLEEKAYQVAMKRGVLLPIDLAKELNIETYMAAALLSSLEARKKLKRTVRRYGSSPIYYLPMYEDKAKAMLYSTLKDYEKKVVDLLRQKRVLVEDQLSPQVRVALQGLLDFAVPLIVVVNGVERKVWKYYKVSDEELKKLLGQQEEKPKEMQEPSIQEEKPKPKPKPRVKKKESEETPDLSKLGEVVEIKKVRKGEWNAIVRKDYALFFVKVKRKKRISEEDIAKAYVEAMQKKLPLIFVGNVSNKLKEWCKEHFGHLVILANE